MLEAVDIQNHKHHSGALSITFCEENADDVLNSLTYTPNGNLQLQGFYFRAGFLF